MDRKNTRDRQWNIKVPSDDNRCDLSKPRRLKCAMNDTTPCKNRRGHYMSLKFSATTEALCRHKRNCGTCRLAGYQITEEEEEQGVFAKDHLKKTPTGGLPTDGVQYN